MNTNPATQFLDDVSNMLSDDVYVLDNYTVLLAVEDRNINTMKDMLDAGLLSETIEEFEVVEVAFSEETSHNDDETYIRHSNETEYEITVSFDYPVSDEELPEIDTADMPSLYEEVCEECDEREDKRYRAFTVYPNYSYMLDLDGMADNQSLNEAASLEEQFKVVVRGRNRKLRKVCPKGQKVNALGSCEIESPQERINRRIGMRKAIRTFRNRGPSALRRRVLMRSRSMLKRRELGLK